MFTRATRCLSFVQKSHIFKQVAHQFEPLLFPSFIDPTSLQYSSYNLLSVEKRFCSSAPKFPDCKDQQISSENNVQDNAKQNELQLMLGNDPIMNKQYKVLQLEIELLRQAGKTIPNEIKPIHWLELLNARTRTSRRKLLTFLFKLEKSDENKKKKKEARIKQEEITMNDIEYDNPYGLNRLTMFLRIYHTSMNHFYHSRLMQAIMFGEKLVVDCGYDTHMTSRESAECAKQLAFLFAHNRVHQDPFDLHFCNINKSSYLINKFRNIIPTAFNDDFPLHVNECSYMDIFDKKKLVYLTPHSNNEMKEYDSDSIYIIGALVDMTNSQPLSLAKAKKEGLRMAKLPINKYLLWGAGASKRLPLNHMIAILLELKATNNWNKAFAHLPRRKLHIPDQRGLYSCSPSEQLIRHKVYQSRRTEPDQQQNFSFEERQKRRFSK